MILLPVDEARPWLSPLGPEQVPGPVPGDPGGAAGQQFDEILLSTLPVGLSRWLGLDLPSRVRRHFTGPVTVTEASN